jgi:hypothetical protein
MERKSKKQGSKHGERRLITKIGQHNENKTLKIQDPKQKVENTPEFCIPEFCGDSTHVLVRLVQPRLYAFWFLRHRS